MFSFFFFFNDTATTEIYTLSLHDALPILRPDAVRMQRITNLHCRLSRFRAVKNHDVRSEEHTSELQSLAYLVCRLLLEKKKKNIIRLQAAHTNLHSDPYRDSFVACYHEHV